MSPSTRLAVVSFGQYIAFALNSVVFPLIGFEVHLPASRAAIKASPVWDADAPFRREYETRLYDYHRRPVYWSDHARRAAPVAAHPHA